MVMNHAKRSASPAGDRDDPGRGQAAAIQTVAAVVSP